MVHRLKKDRKTAGVQLHLRPNKQSHVGQAPALLHLFTVQKSVREHLFRAQPSFHRFEFRIFDLNFERKN